jgi:cytochrome b pre-mRNA-processing protein 3
MIFRLFRRSTAVSIDALYGAIVAQARRPVFYAGFAAPDTVEGRFDLLVLHVVLVLRRLRPGGEGQGSEPGNEQRRAQPQEPAQALFDAFCRDLDHNLREMGVGDLSVPKQMKRLGEAFYGRQRAYEEALADDDPGRLAAAIRRNVFSGGGPHVERLADYARSAAALLDATDVAAIAQGRLAFPDPDAILGDVAHRATE